MLYYLPSVPLIVARRLVCCSPDGLIGSNPDGCLPCQFPVDFGLDVGEQVSYSTTCAWTAVTHLPITPPTWNMRVNPPLPGDSHPVPLDRDGTDERTFSFSWWDGERSLLMPACFWLVVITVGPDRQTCQQANGKGRAPSNADNQRWTSGT